MEQRDASVDRKIGEMASRSHGVVTRRGLLTAGISPEEIRGRLKSGVLIAVHRGVYRVGHQAPSLEASYLAAVLACGDGAALSGRAAAYLWRLVKGNHPPSPAVTTPVKRRVPGVKTHTARAIRRTTWNGIPVTTVPQALVDLAAVLSLEELALACHEAGVRYKTTPAMVEKVLRPNAPGAHNMHLVTGRKVLVTIGKLEKLFLKRLDEAGLRRPDETNRPAGSKRVDCRWIRERVTVELDSYAFHNSFHSWKQGHLRDREAYARGDEMRRYTWWDVNDDPRPMLRELAGLLGR